MQFRKHISKLLALGILTNNIYFNSSANTEIPNRYQTLEGEHITIDDSTEGELVEIEVFGNTVQDENNLEDIQSVGDLYVDDEGNPILDNQGRKQYKIDIVSNSGNLFNKEGDINQYPEWNGLYTASFGLVNGYKQAVSNLYNKEDDVISIQNYIASLKGAGVFIKLKPNTDYTFKGSSVGTEVAMVSLFKADEPLTQIGERLSILNNTTRAITIRTTDATDYFVMFNSGVHGNTCLLKDFQIIEGVYDDDEVLSYGSKITTILLPTQLQKVGNLADRLYWDNEKKKYVVEKNIGTSFIDGADIVEVTPHGSAKYRVNMYDAKNVKFSHLDMSYAARARNIAYYTSDVVNDIGLEKNNIIDEGTYMYLDKEKYENSVYFNRFREYFNENNVIVYGELKEPQLIETNIASKIKIPTYDVATHIFAETENGVNPTLKVTVDRLPQIARNSVLEAETDSSSANISLARMYINMLPESTYKDQLQEQLSQVFSSDIILERKDATANLDVYIKSENMLSMSLNTNSVSFDNYSGVSSVEIKDAVGITISSSLPYNLNAYMPSGITNSDGSKTMPIDILNIKEGSNDNYQTFASNSDKVVLKGDCAKGNGTNHSIDLKLDSSDAYVADVYKTVIKFEAEQK